MPAGEDPAPDLRCASSMSPPLPTVSLSLSRSAVMHPSPPLPPPPLPRLPSASSRTSLPLAPALALISHPFLPRALWRLRQGPTCIRDGWRCDDLRRRRPARELRWGVGSPPAAASLLRLPLTAIRYHRCTSPSLPFQFLHLHFGF